MPTSRAASAPAPAALSWDKFEEHAKVAFVANASGSRLFFKTSSTPSATTKRASLHLVARVSTHRKTASELTHHTSTYHSTSGDSLARVTRLLRFAMQEVLGPMRTTGVMSPRTGPSGLGAVGLPSLTLASPTSNTPPAGGDKTKKKKKKKSKK